MVLRRSLVALVLFVATANYGWADIFRWDNGQLVPGTQGITPGPGVQLDRRLLEFADLKSIDLTGASFYASTLTNADLSVSTLTNANVSGANLTNASFENSTLRNVSFTDALVSGAKFYGTTSVGFTKEQLYSTASYQQRNMQGIGIGNNDLTGWDFSEQNLTGASLSASTLTNVNLSGALVSGADLGNTTPNSAFRGLTKEQLYSTSSYQQKDLRGIGLANLMDLTGWDFSGQDLTSANFENSYLTNANFTEALVSGANLSGTTFVGFTKEQLYSTASYQKKNLQGISFRGDDLTGWDFSGQNLTRASFENRPRLMNTDFSSADLRYATVVLPSNGQLTRNTIRPTGEVTALELPEGDSLIVRDFELGITVTNKLVVADGGVLELLLADVNWGSKLTVAAGIMPDLGGTLRIRFADDINLASLPGTTFDLFDWSDALDAGNRFDNIDLPVNTVWNLSMLYTTGEATLTAIPEPSAIVLLMCGIMPCAFRWWRDPSVPLADSVPADWPDKVMHGSPAIGDQEW